MAAVINGIILDEKLHFLSELVWVFHETVQNFEKKNDQKITTYSSELLKTHKYNTFISHNMMSIWKTLFST